MDKLFIMFHKESKNLFGLKGIQSFQNGFSHTWNNCKKQGDMIWLKHGEDPPITKGTIFVSTWYKADGLEAERWALENPNLNVVIGGPLLSHYKINIGKELHNFKQIQKQNVEESLNIPITNWNLEILPGYDNIIYSFGITNGIGCYWGKCSFCKYHHKAIYREFENIPMIDYPGHKYIWLHTFSMPSYMINEIYSKLPNRKDVSYITYMRADKKILNSLKKVFNKPSIPTENLMFDLGIEVPSNRMLKWMKKGTTVESYLELINFLCKKKCKLHFNLMVDWPNLTEEDVKDVENFLKNLKTIEGHNTIVAKLYPLQIVYDRPFIKEFRDILIQEKNSFWNVNIFHVCLTEEQKSINNSLRNLYNNFPFSNFEDFTGRKLW